jgi:hypothetical protein
MIIYVNVNKNTGEVIVNNDLYPGEDMLAFNPNTLENTNEYTKFEIAFNTTDFEKIHNPTLNNMDNINGNTN